MRVQLVKEFLFEAAHRREDGGEGPARLHGHSYRVGLAIRGEVGAESGWVMDYGEIKARFAPLYARLDHHCLNDVEGLTDASFAGIARWIEDRMRPVLPELEAVYVGVVGPCRFRPAALDADPVHGLPPRVRFGFEAAHRLVSLPPEHKCRRLHGHSFSVEVAAEGLDASAAPLSELYDALDHRYLNEIPGLENPTSEVLGGWIWRRLAPQLRGVRAVIVQETCTARCVYHGD